MVDAPAGAGPAEARNRGAREADTELVVFVDADVEVHDDALTRLRAALALDPELVAVFGGYDDAPADPRRISQFRNLLHHHVHATAAGSAETFWAGLGAVRRDAFLAAGGFDSRRYPLPAIEDIELGMRLRAAGGRILLDPAIRGKHLKRWRLIEMTRTDFARRAVPWIRLQLEARRLSRSLNLSARHRISTLASLSLGCAMLARRPGPVATSAAVLGILNASFYRLLARRGGPVLVVVGVPLHVLHHLLAIVALPVAVAAHARTELRGGGPCGSA